ncbi:hypothetical protein LCGC14_3096680 [marine sediment metagenome]|uniref:Uncharacterized protein n=1 Tax=marine sediment metagenome TaxID=412755 RepID=A0A0F8YGE6_9ZZZZ
MIKIQIEKQKLLEKIKKVSEKLENLNNMIVSKAKYLSQLDKKESNDIIREHRDALLNLIEEVKNLSPSQSELSNEFGEIDKEIKTISDELNKLKNRDNKKIKGVTFAPQELPNIKSIFNFLK